MPGVVSLPVRPQNPTQEETAALKRLAIQVVAQLPAERSDALAVLEYARTLVESFLGGSGPILS